MGGDPVKRLLKSSKFCNFIKPPICGGMFAFIGENMFVGIAPVNVPVVIDPAVQITGAVHRDFDVGGIPTVQARKLDAVFIVTAGLFIHHRMWPFAACRGGIAALKFPYLYGNLAL